MKCLHKDRIIKKSYVYFKIPWLKGWCSKQKHMHIHAHITVDIPTFLHIPASK